MQSRADNSRGTVTLVALCFVVVLGIVLGSYIAVCSRAMNLSNRSFQASLSQQLAEFGLEEGLRAFNSNKLSGSDTTAALADWTNGGITANWTLDTTNKRATAAISFPANKFGQGVTATIKIRVDNYDAASLPAAWSSGTNYLIDNVVSYTDGNWYRCIAGHLNKTPATTTSNSMYWIQEHNSISSSMTWTTGTTYNQGNMVNRLGNWFRYTNSTGSTTAPPITATSNSLWTYVPYVSADADLHYTNESILNYYNTWYRYYSTIPWESNPTLTWRYRAGSYSVGDVVCYNNVWYRCKTAHTGGASLTAAYWDSASTLTASAGTAWAGWDTTYSYFVGDVVYYSSRWYRCLIANSGQTPSTTSAYWTVSPIQSTQWDANRQYSQYDTVRYNGVWYLSLANGNTSQNPSTATSYWIGANTTNTSYLWNSTTNYASGAYRSYGGVWYKASAANTNKSPNNPSFWTPSWANSSGNTTGAPVIYAEATISISGNPPSVTQLRTTIDPSPLFPNALTASSTLSLNSGTIDSYDSKLAAYGGTNIGTSAVLAAGSSITTTGTLAISGYLAWPSPPAGISTGTTLNGTAFSDDKSRVSRSPQIPNFSIHDVAGGIQLTSTNTTLGYAGSTTPVVYYYNSAGITNMNLNSSGEVLTIAGPVILYVAGNFRSNTYASARIRILPTGSLRLVVGGNFRLESGGGGIENQTNDPSKLTVLCSKSGAGTFEISSTAYDFYGTVYIPNSSSTLTVADSVAIYGALSAQSITTGSSVNLHYDTALRYSTTDGVDQPYAITQWRELPLTEQATMP